LVVGVLFRRDGARLVDGDEGSEAGEGDCHGAVAYLELGADYYEARGQASLGGQDVGVQVVQAESAWRNDAFMVRIRRQHIMEGEWFVTYRSLVANAPTTTAFGFHDIWRSPTRYIDTRKRAKSVVISMAPMASQRVDYTGRM